MRRNQKGNPMGFKWLDELLGDSHETETTVKALVSLAYTKTSVRIQIENSSVRFMSQVAVLRNTITFGKPFGLNGELTAGTFVRLRLPGNEKRELRLEVMIPHYNLANGNVAFICKAPEQELVCRRQADRFEALRYKNLRLVIGTEPFRLSDISATGFKVVLVGNQSMQHFPLRCALHNAQLDIGAEAHIYLDWLIPRNYRAGMVGCEFRIKQDPESKRKFNALLSSLSRAELTRIGA
jgi:hypothetical protein